MTMTFIEMFLIALQIAIPIVGSLLLIDIALGILAKSVPQLNVFVVGLPIKIFVGFILIIFDIADLLLHITSPIRKNHVEHVAANRAIRRDIDG